MADQDIDLSMPPVSDPHRYMPALPPRASTLLQTSGGLCYNPNPPEKLTEKELAQLQQQGFPTGLAMALAESARKRYPVRFWVVDNSGSMRANDGVELRGTDTNLTVVKCTRWKELQGTIHYHSQLAGFLQATTVFRLLNDPGVHAGPQEVAVASVGAPQSISEQVASIHSVMTRSEPQGVTPLTFHLEEIKQYIQRMSLQLQGAGQKVVIVLATDGLPSNQQGDDNTFVRQAFTNTLKSLQALPVWIVVRLCTDDRQVVDYYNELDAKLELPLEVIDDYFMEAKEINKVNPWLNYALPLHRCREMGYHHRLFDLLDERLLNKDELVEFLQILFGPTTVGSHHQQWPDPVVDWKGFVAQLTAVVRQEGPRFHPVSKKMAYWIDLPQLERCFGGTQGGFLGRMFSVKRHKKPQLPR